MKRQDLSVIQGAPSGPAIAFEKLNKWYGSHHVLKDIELTVGHGERVVVCGPSGSGKSTLIRCVNGLEPFQKGALRVSSHQKLQFSTQEEKESRARVGMVFQHFNLFPHLSVLENCILAPTSLGLQNKQDAREQAMALLARVRIEHKAHAYPRELSGGQQQRVAIARALCLSPDIMLFDEPTSALDPEMVKEVLDTMFSLADEGMTMVCVTHEMTFARQVAHRVVFMADGQVLEVAPPAEFFDNPQHERAQQFLSLLHA